MALRVALVEGAGVGFIGVMVEVMANAIGAAGVLLLLLEPLMAVKTGVLLLLEPMLVEKALALGVFGVAESPLARGDGAKVPVPLMGGVFAARLRFLPGIPGLLSSSGAASPFSAARPALTHLLRKALDWVLTIVLL
jgi:hypothetical protein